MVPFEALPVKSLNNSVKTPRFSAFDQCNADKLGSQPENTRGLRNTRRNTPHARLSLRGGAGHVPSTHKTTRTRSPVFHPRRCARIRLLPPSPSDDFPDASRRPARPYCTAGVGWDTSAGHPSFPLPPLLAYLLTLICSLPAGLLFTCRRWLETCVKMFRVIFVDRRPMPTTIRPWPPSRLLSQSR
jgi:hypothetical protein